MNKINHNMNLLIHTQLLPSFVGRGLAAGLLLLLLWACSSDDNDETSTAYTFTSAPQPAWSVDLSGNEPVPTWEAPDPSKYESSMFLLIKLEDELVPYSTDGDLMTLFINGECRAVPSVRNVDQNNNIYFVLKVRGSSNDHQAIFTLFYYCASLHQMFSCEGQENFATEITYGYNEDAVLPLYQHSTKYPVSNHLTVTLPQQTPFVADEDDCVAAFVGNECRGTGFVGTPFFVLRKNASETIQLRYYSKQRGGIYTLSQSVALAADEEKTIELKWQ